MKKEDRNYIEARIEEIRKETGLNFVLHGDNMLGVRMTPGGGLDCYCHGKARDIMTYLDGMCAMIFRVPRNKNMPEYTIPTTEESADGE